MTSSDYSYRHSDISTMTKAERVSIAESIMSDMDLGNSNLLNSELEGDEINEEEN